MNNDSLFTAASWAQIISVIVAVITTAITIYLSIWLYRRGQQKREITCILHEIDSLFELKSGNAFKHDITILYQGKPVENLYVVRATLKNTGTLPIRNHEVIEPITFSFSYEVEIIKEPQVIKVYPANLPVKWHLNLNQSETTSGISSASLEFELLNPGESITVDFICTGKVELPNVLARIEGISFIHIGIEVKLSDSPLLLNSLESVARSIIRNPNPSALLDELLGSTPFIYSNKLVAMFKGKGNRTNRHN